MIHFISDLLLSVMLEARSLLPKGLTNALLRQVEIASSLNFGILRLF